MHHAFNKPRLFEDKNQKRYMSTLIVLQQNKTIVSCAQKQIASTNDPTKVTNTKIYGRHKYLLVNTASIYATLYSRLEHWVLLLIGWPPSSFLQLERFLYFSLGIHRNKHSDSLILLLFVHQKQHKLAQGTRQSANAINVSLCSSGNTEHTF